MNDMSNGTVKGKDEDDDLLTESMFESTSKENEPSNINREIAEQKRRQELNRAAILGGGGLLGAGLQALNMRSILKDPTITSMQGDLASAAARTRERGPVMTEREEQDIVESVVAPVQRRVEAVSDEVQARAASTGDTSARTQLQAEAFGLKQISDQALKGRALAAQEKVARRSERRARIEQAKRERDEIRATMLELRNAYIREPTHKFIGEVAKFAGTMFGYSAARGYEPEYRMAREKGATADELKQLKQMEGRVFARKKMRDYLKNVVMDKDNEPDPKQQRGQGSRTRATEEGLTAEEIRQDALNQTSKKFEYVEGETAAVMESGDTVMDRAAEGPYLGVVYEMLENGDIQFELGGETKTVTKDENPRAHAAIMELYRSKTLTGS